MAKVIKKGNFSLVSDDTGETIWCDDCDRILWVNGVSFPPCKCTGGLPNCIIDEDFLLS